MDPWTSGMLTGIALALCLFAAQSKVWVIAVPSGVLAVILAAVTGA